MALSVTIRALVHGAVEGDDAVAAILGLGLVVCAATGFAGRARARSLAASLLVLGGAAASPWLLDSALRLPRLGRFSFAGADPWLELRARGERVEVHCRRRVRTDVPVGRRVLRGDFFEVARGLLPRLPADVEPELPFVGGVVGYLGYELAERLERLDLGGDDDLGLPDAVLLYVDRLLVWDHERDRAWAVALGCGERPERAREAAERSVASLCERLTADPAPPRAQGPSRPSPPFAHFDESRYVKAVDRVKE